MNLKKHCSLDGFTTVVVHARKQILGKVSQLKALLSLKCAALCGSLGLDSTSSLKCSSVQDFASVLVMQFFCHSAQFSSPFRGFIETKGIWRVSIVSVKNNFSPEMRKFQKSFSWWLPKTWPIRTQRCHFEIKNFNFHKNLEYTSWTVLA